MTLFCRCYGLFKGISRGKLLPTLRTYSCSTASRLSIKQTLSTPIQHGESKPVAVEGWVRSVRKHADVVFIHVNDGTAFHHLQIVAISQQLPVAAIQFGSSIKVSGNLVKSKGTKQSVEVVAENIEVVGHCDHLSYPFKAGSRHSLDYMRQYLHLRPRTMWFGALLRIRNAAAMAIHKYFQNEGFCMIQTPILTSNDCEGAGEVFTVEPADKSLLDVTTRSSDVGGGDSVQQQHFFGDPAYLTVSGQLHLEVMTGALSKVYTFGPTFRAENSHTRHHLSEFSMVEAEIAFTQSVEDIMTVVEGLIKYTTKEVLDLCQPDVEFMLKSNSDGGQQKPVAADTLSSKPFVRLSYSEVIKVLEQHNNRFQNKASWGVDLSKEHEQFLVEHCGHVPVFVTDYPAIIKPFYARCNDDERTVAAVDLLAPGVGEICGGSLREERLAVLERRISEAALKGNLDWYLDLRRFGAVSHGGFGVGFERYIQALLCIQNIKDTIPFPRTANNCHL